MDTSELSPFSDTLGAVAFWLGLGIAASLVILIPYLQKREIHKTIRKALEMAQPLDPALVEKLSARQKESSPGELLFGGVMTLAMGPGLALMGYFLGLDKPQIFHKMLGVGSLMTFFGIAMTGFALWWRAQVRKGNGGQANG